MCLQIKKAVSKKKRRFQDGTYDLDLTYIKPNLIAMGFPAEKVEGFYRNRIDDVVRFLEEKHKDRYKVYNLCSERNYDPVKFHSRVAHYPFDDHNPPRIELIKPFCEDVDSWLAKNPDNVAVIHCKAGKGRTGVMLSAYLLHRGVKQNASEALKFYDETRTQDHKGVTIPSQRRYVGYYDQLLKARPETYKEKMLCLKGIKFITIPHHTNLTPQIVISKSSSSSDSSVTKIYESLPVNISNASRFDSEMCLEFPEKIPVSGDTLISLVNKPSVLRKERMFLFWFNTYFVKEEGESAKRNGSEPSDLYCKMSDNPKLADTKVRSNRIVRAASSFTFDTSKCVVLRLTKQELDKANKDRSHKLFDPNFQVVCYFEKEVVPGVVKPGIAGTPLADDEIIDEDLSDTDTETES